MGLFHWGIDKKKPQKPRLSMESLEDRITPTVQFTFGPNSPIAIGNNTSPDAITVADFNNDGIDDVATANSASNNISVLLGSSNQDGSFQSPIFTAAGTTPTDITASDVNGDSIQDLIVANSTSADISVLIGNGDGTFETAVPYNVVGTPVFVGAADFSGDGVPDLAVVDSDSGTVDIFINNGNGTGTFGARTSYAVGGTPLSMDVGDFNRDGVLDLAVANSSSNNVSLLIGQGNGAFTVSGSTPSVGAKPVSIVTGDYNNDGKLDLATLNQTGNSISILQGDGTGNFSAANSFGILGSNSVAMTTADFNDDGNLDLVVATKGNSAVVVYQGNGNLTFQTGQGFSPSGQAPGALAIGDFNLDGNLDIATANPSTFNSVSILLGYTPGAALTSATNVNAPATSYQFTVTYADRTAIDVSTISSTNIIVTGPNNVTLTATLVSINSNTDGSPRSAVYQITPPGGSWDINDSGTYSINLKENQVANTAGVTVRAATLGSFRVSITNELNNLGVGYVNGLYQSILGRTGDAAGLAYWNGKLDDGAAKDTLFIGFWVSREHRTLQVQGYYRDFLHREADAVGLSFWVAKFAQGASELDVIQGFMGSAEYRNINGGTATSVITAIYNDLLGRTPSASEIQIWVPAFNSSGSAAVAKGVVQSAEYQLDLVKNDYVVFLNRPLVAQSEIDANLAIINSKGPLSEQDLALKFAVSSEFINLTLETLPT